MQEPNAEKQIASEVKNLKKYGTRINAKEYVAIAPRLKSTAKKSPKKAHKRLVKKSPN